MNEECGQITRKSLLMAMKLIPKMNNHKHVMMVDFITRQSLRGLLTEYEKWRDEEDAKQI